MKVIDLLNKIANGEELPRKFMVDGDTLYIGEDKYIEYESGKKIKWLIYPSWLNEEVEIIEENKKVKKIDMFDYFTGYDFGGTNKELLRHLELNFSSINDVLNKVIDKVNELEDK